MACAYSLHSTEKSKTSVAANPGDAQIFYSPTDRTANGIIERLANKFCRKFDVAVATSDLLEREMVTALGAYTIFAEILRVLIAKARDQDRRANY